MYHNQTHRTKHKIKYKQKPHNEHFEHLQLGKHNQTMYSKTTKMSNKFP